MNSLVELPEEERSRQKGDWLIVCRFFFEKRIRLLSKLQRKPESTIALIQSRLIAGTVNYKFNRYDDFLRLFLDVNYQYHIKRKISEQAEDGN